MAKGMILAAGQGTRVRPLTKYLPKPMVPILGKPVMEYLIEHLASFGITEIMVNVAFQHQKIEQYFGDGHRWGVQLGYSYEGTLEHGDVIAKPMGSAGGMRRIQDFSGFFDETTLVLCGDALIDLVGHVVAPLHALVVGGVERGRAHRLNAALIRDADGAVVARRPGPCSEHRGGRHARMERGFPAHSVSGQWRAAHCECGWRRHPDDPGGPALAAPAGHRAHAHPGRRIVGRGGAGAAAEPAAGAAGQPHRGDSGGGADSCRGCGSGRGALR